MNEVQDFIRRFLSKDSEEILRRLPSKSGGYLRIINDALFSYGHVPTRMYCTAIGCSGYMGWIERSRMAMVEHPVHCEGCGKVFQ